jgi:thiamine biosynthesis lipoprotein
MLLALTCAADLTRATAGRFDPTIIDALERSGYDRTFTAITADRNDAPVVGRTSTTIVPGFAPVEIDEARSRVRLPAGTRIDLGGVGKGLAADLIARGLVDRGARHALVALGGDVRVRGEPIGNIGGDGWNIPVVDPFADDRILFRVPLTDGAIVTSTTRIRRWTRADREFHHIVDPATGDPTRTGVAAVVASARDAWWAEGIAKAIIVGGIDAGIQLAVDARVRVWMFLDDRTTIEAGPGA